jgi:AraC family transcriptional regulator
MILLNTLTQSNIGPVANRPFTENGVSYSLLTQVDIPMSMRGFSIKYVTEGVEHYQLNRANYALRPQRYLLVHPEHNGRVLIHSPFDVKGLCINITPHLMAQIMATHQRPEAITESPEQWSMADLHQLWKVPIHGDNAALVHRLNQMIQSVATTGQHDTPAFTQEFFYEAATMFLSGYGHLGQQLLACKAVKKSTRIELMHRLALGREVIESSFTQSIDIAWVARQARMSEYHFFRLFKAVYGLSPYQLLLQRRMELGQQLLNTQRYSVSETALHCGFSDIFSFSKAFKKHFGVAPSKWAN